MNKKFGEGTETTTAKEKFYNQYSVYKFMSSVENRLKKDIGSDFVLSKLSEQDKEFIVEMVANSYSAKNLLDTIKEEMGEKHEDYNKVGKIANNLFDTMMTKVYMLVVLNRNVDKNYIIKIIGEAREDDEAGKEETDKLIKMVNKMGGKEEE